jgi:hypothetical protein
MINYDILKQSANDLSNLDKNQFIKVAGVVRRLYNWFKQLSSEEYRQQVVDLKNNSTTVQTYMAHLSKQLNRLQAAIKDADVQDYEQALEEVKYLSGQLTKELERLQETTNNVDLPQTSTDKPVSSEEQVNNEIVEKIPAPISEEPDNKVQKPFRNIERFNSLPIVISDNVKAKILENLPKDINFNQPQFFELFSTAIQNGTVTKITPVAKEGRNSQFYVTVKTAPFSVPDVAYKFISTVLLNEIPDKKLSVMRVISFHAEKFAHNRIKNLKKIAAEVDRNHSEVDQVEFAQALMSAYTKLFGKAPTAQTLGVLWAQAVLESGRKGNKIQLRNNNIGGITAGNYDKKFNESGWLESNKPYITAKTGLKFKSFDSLNDGALEYVKTLKSLYPESFKWKAAGMPFEDALYMASKNYYGPISVDSYGKPMDNLFSEFMSSVYPKLNPKPENRPEPPPAPPKNQYKLFGENPYLPKDKVSQNTIIDKPELKSKQYAWSSSSVNNTPTLNQDSNVDNEMSNLMNYLFAAKSMDQIVKEAISKKLLGSVNVLIKINSVNSISSYNYKMKYAIALSEVLNDTINAKTEIYSDGTNIEIMSEVIGSKNNVINAVNEVCESVSAGFLNKYNKIVKCSINLNTSSLNKISDDVLNIMERKFHLISLANNDLSYSAVMRDLRKNNPDKINLFMKTFKIAFDEAIEADSDDADETSLIKALDAINYNAK